MRFLSLALALSAGVSLAGGPARPQTSAPNPHMVVYRGERGPGLGKHIVFLAGDGVLLMKDSIAADVKRVGQPTAADVLKKAVDLKIPIHV